MSETTINQRLIFLMDALKMKAGPFSRALGLSETTVRNYVDRNSKPSSDVLEKIFHTFSHVNLVWLVTGNGEPFFIPSTENGQTTPDAQIFFKSPVVGTNHGTANQQQHTNSGSDADDLKTQLALAQQETTLAKQEVESLRAQLALKDTIIASKEETIDLLKAAFNRPN